MSFFPLLHYLPSKIRLMACIPTFSYWSLLLLLLAGGAKAQCVTTSLSFTNCPSSAGQSFTNQGGANNGTAPNPTCNYGTGSPSTSTWISFVYDPTTMQYLMGNQAAGQAGNDPALAIYSADGCTLLGCNDDFNNTNSMPGFSNSTGALDLSTLGLLAGNTYLARVYNEGNTANVKAPSITCVPPSPCGDCFTSPCAVTNINTSFTATTNGTQPDNCCTWVEDQWGAVPALNCAGPGAISSDGNMYYSFSICGTGQVTATISYQACSDAAGAQIWFITGCNGNSLACSNTGDMTTVTISYNSFSVGTTYYVMVDSYGGNICDFTLTMTGPVCATMPIDLISFSAKPHAGRKALLQWATASETNNNHFIVERSQDGYSYEEIATVDAAGNSTEYKAYSLTDEAPLAGTSYYRLRQVDLNGEYSYSHIEAFNLKKSAALEVYPNPLSSNKLYVNRTGLSAGPVVLEIKNALGETVFSRQLDAAGEAGVEEVKLDDELPAGTYQVSIQDAGEQVHQMLVVQR